MVPRGTPVHHLVELGFPPTSFDLVGYSPGCSLPGPAELCAVNPDTMQDHGQPSRQRDNRSFHPAPSGNLHRPWHSWRSLKSQITQGWVIARTASQRPVIFALALLDWQIVYVGNPPAHEALLVEFPIFIAI